MSAIAVHGHPCFDESSHNSVGRMHISVAPACNIKCRYCHREIGSADNRPGVAYKILSPFEALEAVEKVVSLDKSIQVVAVAGPGDALANEASFKSLKLINERFPSLKKCISTNGLRLAERIDDLVSVGVSTISVTVNAIDPEIGRQFYKRAYLDGRIYREDAFDILAERQIAGIKAAASKGLAVKINTVLVPKLNAEHIEELAKAMHEAGAYLMNIMPLKPLGEMSTYRAPTCLDLEDARHKAEQHILVFRLCKQCRADAVGIPGLEREHGGYNQTLSEILPAVPLYH